MGAIEGKNSGSGVRIAQFVSIFVMWMFVISISVWIVNLLALAIELNDALEASIGIGLVAIPVYLTLASILTYVFFGLRREARRFEKGEGGGGEE